MQTTIFGSPRRYQVAPPGSNVGRVQQYHLQGLPVFAFYQVTPFSEEGVARGYDWVEDEKINQEPLILLMAAFLIEEYY